MAEYKQQHYLPVCYLYGFTSDEQRARVRRSRQTPIWHYDVRRNGIFEHPLEKIAKSSYLYSFRNPSGDYDHAIERSFGLLEEKTSEILRKLELISKCMERGRPYKQLSVVEIQTLIEFVFYMLKRSRHFLQELHKKVRTGLQEVLPGHELTDTEIKKQSLKVMMTIGSKFDLFSRLMGKNKYFLFANPRLTSYITCDAPVVRFNKDSPDGLGESGTEIYFPVHKHCLLFMLGDGDVVEYKRHTDRAQIRQLNQYMAGKANDYVISASERYLRRILRGKSR